MKKVLLICLLIGVLAVGGWALWFFTRLSSVSVPDVLPENPLFYVQVSDVNKHWSQFKSSDFGSHLSRVNIVPLIRNIPVLVQLEHSFQALKETMNTPDTKEYLNKFLGQEVTIAVYRNAIDETSLLNNENTARALDQFMPEVFWVSRVPGDMKIKEFAMRSASSKTEELNLEKIFYRDHVIYVLPLDSMDLKLSFTRIGDLFIAGLSDTVVRKAIDVYKGVRVSLADDNVFHEALKGIRKSNSGLNVYWNAREFFGLMANVSSSDPAVSQAIQGASGLTYGGFSVVWSDMLQMSNEIHFDPSPNSSVVKDYVSACRPDQNQSLSFTPQDVLLYQSFSCLNLPKYWEQITVEVGRLESKQGEQGSRKDTIRTFEESIGLSIEKDLLPLFGSEIGWFLNVASQSIPALGIKIPQFVFFVKISDVDKAKKAVNYLLSKTLVKRQLEAYQGIEVTLFPTPLGGAVEPGFMFFRDYLIVGLNKDILRETVNSSDKHLGKNILTNNAFNKVVKNAAKGNIGIFYFEMEALLDRYGGLIDLLSRWMSAQQQQKMATASSASIENSVEELNAKILQKQEELKSLDDTVWEAESKGEDVSDEKARMSEIKEEIRGLEKEIDLVERKSAASEDDDRPQIDEATAFFRNVVNPLIKALSSVEALGATTRLEKDHFSTDILVNFGE